MAEPRILRFYLDDDLRQSAQDGKHNFINKIRQVAENSGYRVEFLKNSIEARQKSASLGGFALFHMDDPTHDRALTIRRVYHYPFWAIEHTAKRWDWRVARTEFPADDVTSKEAGRFYRFWQKRLFGDAPARARHDGFVYVPLQGRLLDHRSFQSCSPIRMIHEVLKHDPHRPVIAALHPKETYDALELAELEKLEAGNARLTLQLGGMEDLLERCDYVVTQNSSAAFNGFFFGKPAVLFGQSDFHHIAADVTKIGAAQAIRTAPDMAPDYAGFIHWFWQRMSINAGRDEATDQIRAAFERAGWPV